MTSTPVHHRSPDSVRCASAKPNRLMWSSARSGWTSLHLDLHEGAGRSAVFETHSTDDLTLVVGVAGEHEVDAFSGGRWRSAVYRPGNAGLTPPRERARLRWRTPTDDRSFETLHIYVPGSLLEDLADEYRRIGRPADPGALSALSFRDELVFGQARALLRACQGGEPDIYAAGASRWLLTHLLSAQAPWRHLMDDDRLAPVLADRRLARVIEYMSVNLGRALTLDDLAREAGISVHHFGRRFRESTGVGPSRYLTGLRMAQARLLLRTTDLPISEIGIRCGYPGASAFATAFLRDVGRTATSYRASP